ncbi:MAG: hypothetical protein IPP96_17775 [Chitinophagaceae bacterium]|nr:hypothetical protein [Chitinophagaceae bacterium]
MYAWVVENTDAGRNFVAKIWKNGSGTSLTTGKAVARSVFVSGTDVYVAGYEYNGTHQVATVWKNGVTIPLSNGTSDMFANSVFVYGTDVYVAGREEVGPVYFAKIWKNGVLTTSANQLPLFGSYFHICK